MTTCLETLRALRAAAVEENIGELDDVLANPPGLREEFTTLFTALLPEAVRQPPTTRPPREPTRRQS